MYFFKLNNDTKNIINSKILHGANKNIVLINASRGGVINEENLYQFLIKNKKSKAFLDCFVKEPYYGELLKLENVLGYHTLHHILMKQEKNGNVSIQKFNRIFKLN